MYLIKRIFRVFIFSLCRRHSTCSHFRDNQGSEGSADTTSVTVYRVLISFQGNCSFLDNQGGGISLLGSRMDVRGSVVFDGNTAVFGGAIAMSGRSQVLALAS